MRFFAVFYFSVKNEFPETMINWLKSL